MRKTISLAFVLVCTTLCSTGCKSTGFKMPGSSLLSWNREPDASVLAGKDEVPQLPESPAAKYTPGTIASVGAQTSGSSSLAASTSGASSAYGYSGTATSSPKTGLAAQANGYQTGPYQMSGVANTATPSATAVSPSTSMAANASLPNPYGGTYGGVTSTTAPPNLALPTNMQNTLAANAPATPAGYPNVSLPSATSGGLTSPAAAQQGNFQVSYPSAPAASATAQSSYTAPQLPSYPSLPSGTAGSGVSSPVSSAYQGATTLGGASAIPGNSTAPAGYTPGSYAPGTTGRSTSYNFGTAPTTNILPPNTASGSNQLLR